MIWYARPYRPDDIDARLGVPPPRFNVGDVVRSVPGSGDSAVVRTAVEAPVPLYGWHLDRRKWMYRLALPGRRRNRWYFEDQLAPSSGG